jgi:uncharacterized membrane protein
VSGLDVETSLTLYLNLALLFCVVLEPFLFYVLETTTAGLLEYSTSVFGLDIGMMQVLLAGMTYLVIRQEKRSKAGKSRANHLKMSKISMSARIVAAALFLISVSNVFWDSVPIIGNLRFLIWGIAVAVIVLTRAIGRWIDRDKQSSSQNKRAKVEVE